MCGIIISKTCNTTKKEKQSMDVKEKILSGKVSLGIELGSTRIKATLIDDTYAPVASGAYDWENVYENGYWTYSLDKIHNGVKASFASLCADIKTKYGTELNRVNAMGISAMMHGYLAFDSDGNLLVPFRTWRNTTTEEASAVLTELFGFNIPQRWSISHLYGAILRNEPHVGKIAYITTLAGYIHYLLTGNRELGIGDASGMFPVNGDSYDEAMLTKFDELIKDKGYPWNIRDILPKIKLAGDNTAVLTEKGAKFLDESGALRAGITVCPPEGDAGTGMVATNAVAERTGNISAGTSVFAMLVLEKPLSKLHTEIDMVTTPSGSPVAMVHCNNCCGELDAWVNIFGEFAKLSGIDMSKSDIYDLLYKNALKGDNDCGGVMAYNYLSGEHTTQVASGRPMYFRNVDSRMNLANFMRAQLYSAFATLRLGMGILFDEEKVQTDRILAHGGIFKVEGVAQQILSDAISTNVSVMETAGEGGSWGMALLAAYSVSGTEKSLGEWLDTEVFSGMKVNTLSPDEKGTEGFMKFLEGYKKGLSAERILGEKK